MSSNSIKTEKKYSKLCHCVRWFNLQRGFPFQNHAKTNVNKCLKDLQKMFVVWAYYEREYSVRFSMTSLDKLSYESCES